MSLKFRTLISKLWIIPVVLTFYACGPSENTTENEEDATTETNEVKEDLQKVLTDVPEPSEMPYQLKATGAEFDPKLPNPSGDVEKYKTTNNKAALNLGVYATDVGYVSVYEKVQNALDYIDVTKNLGDKLGVTNAFDPEMRERFESNLSSIDTLTKIIDEALKKSDQYLKDNERNSIAAMIFSGSFIEGLYIATQLVDTYPEDLLPEEVKNEVLIGIVTLITEQDKPLEDLINALKSLEKDEDVENLISQLEELLQLYKELNIQEQIENNRGDLILTDETIKGITTKVKEIRGEVVS